MTTLLRGITWGHERGLGGLQATAAACTAVRPRVRVESATLGTLDAALLRPRHHEPAGRG